MSSSNFDTKVNFHPPYLTKYKFPNGSSFDTVYTTAKESHDKWENCNSITARVAKLATGAFFVGGLGMIVGFIFVGATTSVLPVSMTIASVLLVVISSITLFCSLYFKLYSLNAKKQADMQPFLFLDSVKKGNYEQAKKLLESLDTSLQKEFAGLFDLLQNKKTSNSLSKLSPNELFQELTFETKTPPNLSEDKVYHRFTDVICAKDTAVCVGKNVYFHGNEVGKGISIRYFIASQAPSSKDVAVFWQAVFAKHDLIVDLTTKLDKIESYYPTDKEHPSTFDPLSVALMKSEEDSEGAILHTYKISNALTKEEKIIQRYHYPEWIDFGTVSVSLLDKLVKKLEAEFKGTSAWIHCRAGVGRTGTLITAYYLKEGILNKTITKDNLEAELVKMILALRLQRSDLFVQTEEQLDLLRQFGHSLFAE